MCCWFIHRLMARLPHRWSKPEVKHTFSLLRYGISAVMPCSVADQMFFTIFSYRCLDSFSISPSVYGKCAFWVLGTHKSVLVEELNTIMFHCYIHFENAWPPRLQNFFLSSRQALLCEAIRSSFVQSLTWFFSSSRSWNLSSEIFVLVKS